MNEKYGLYDILLLVELMFFKNYPKSIIFELTNRCNLKCNMCDIWKDKKIVDFHINHFNKILKNPALKKLKNISLSGGEPFMLKNLEKYYSLCKTYFPKANICICTNGYFTDSIKRYLSMFDNDKLSIAVSFDGIDSHNKIRGNPNSMKNLINSVIMIKNEFPKVTVSLKFTANYQNYNELLDSAKFANKLSVPLEIKVIESLNCHQTRIITSVNNVLSQDIIKSLNNQSKKILKLGFVSNVKFLQQLIKKSKKDIKTCNWPSEKLFIGVDGNVWICRKKNNIGNVFINSINEIWFSPLKQCNDNTCLSFKYN